MGKPETNSSEIPLILLAGGKSSRLGIPKGLYPAGGKPWILRQIEALTDSRTLKARPVGLVLGHHVSEYNWVFPELLKLCPLSVLTNPHPELGKFSSLQIGIQWAEELGAKAAFVMPIDVPCPTPSVWKTLEESLFENGNFESDPRCLVAQPEFNGVGGHPVLLSTPFMQSLMVIDPLLPEARLDHQIHAISPNYVKRVRVNDPLIGVNLNSQEDFSKHLTSFCSYSAPN